MDVEAQVLTEKEGEGLLYGLAQIHDYAWADASDPLDPMFVLLEKGWSRGAIEDASNDLMELAFPPKNCLPERATPLEADILRCCVENSAWITSYRTYAPTKHSKPHIDEALAALRGLSAKLEKLGIEINHIPFD